MRLEWVHDSAFRFFPTQQDEIFGYVLHPVDLATNKTSAAADRREPRDIVDLGTIHETILPLGAAICAAVGRFPGQSPEEMLADITRHSRFTAEEFRVLATEQPIDVSGLHRRIRSMIADAGRFISRIPSDAVGVVFLERGKAVQPDLDALEKYQRHAGARGGVWPSSPEISTAMLERYKKQNGNGNEPKRPPCFKNGPLRNTKDARSDAELSQRLSFENRTNCPAALGFRVFLRALRGGVGQRLKSEIYSVTGRDARQAIELIVCRT
jgi:hypothetical protein